jgi:hypothetical protein
MTTSFRVVAHDRWRAEHGSVEVPGASSTACRMVALSRALLATDIHVPPHALGLYVALGSEKIDLVERVMPRLRAEGLDVLRPAQVVLTLSPYGAGVTLAMQLSAQGPHVVIEGDQHAFSLAFLQAAGDVARGRATRALVISGVEESITAIVLAPGDDVRVTASFLTGIPDQEEVDAIARALDAALPVLHPREDSDAHGACCVRRALMEALEGTPSASLAACDSGRAVMLGFARGAPLGAR